MAQPKTFSFDLPDEYSSQARELQRRQQWTDAMRQDANTPIETNKMAGRYVVRVSPLEGLAKMLQIGVAGSEQRDVDQKTQKLAQLMQTNRADTLQRAMQAGPGTPRVAPTSDEEGAFGLGNEGAPGARDILARSKDPMLQQYAAQLMMKDLEPQKPVAVGKSLVDPRTGKVVFSEKPDFFAKINPKDYTPESVAVAEKSGRQSDLVPARKMEVGPGGQVYDPYRAVPGQVFNDPNKPFGIGQGGTVAPNLPFQGYEIGKAKAGATNVQVNTEKNLFGDMAGAVGKDIAGQSSQARAAVQTINTVSQIRDALASGKVIAGPGTTARQFLGQVGQVMGIAGKDATEQLVETRKAVQGLAQLELDAAQQMKGQGQITEAERVIIRRAASGDIDNMSIPELNSLMSVMDKTARYKIGANQRNVELLKKQSGTGALPQFMDVPMPEAYKPPANIPPPPPGFQLQGR